MVVNGTTVDMQKFGLDTDGANTSFIMPFNLLGRAVSSSSVSIQVYAYVENLWAHNRTRMQYSVRNINLVISGAKR